MKKYKWNWLTPFYLLALLATLIITYPIYVITGTVIGFFKGNLDYYKRSKACFDNYDFPYISKRDASPNVRKD